MERLTRKLFILFVVSCSPLLSFSGVALAELKSAINKPYIVARKGNSFEQAHGFQTLARMLKSSEDQGAAPVSELVYFELNRVEIPDHPHAGGRYMPPEADRKYSEADAARMADMIVAALAEMDAQEKQLTRERRCSPDANQMNAKELGRLENKLQKDVSLQRKSIYKGLLIELNTDERKDLQAWVARAREGFTEYIIDYEQYYVDSDVSIDPEAMQVRFCNQS